MILLHTLLHYYTFLINFFHLTSIFSFTVTFEGVSFGISGPDAGDMYVEMRSLGHEWSSEDTTCAAPSCEIIASGK